jgi:hypothetical protein
MSEQVVVTAGESQEAPQQPIKYKWPEFAGFAGERYLKTILRKVLCLRLYRSWEIIAVENQAPGNEAYLGNARLSRDAGRSWSTAQKDIESFRTRKLAEVRVDLQLVRLPNGQLAPKPVVVKDFAALYDLAHEYHEWSQSDAYVAPDRQMFDLMKQDPQFDGLLDYLKRFDIYRRLICNGKPGPHAQPKEDAGDAKDTRRSVEGPKTDKYLEKQLEKQPVYRKSGNDNLKEIDISNVRGGTAAIQEEKEGDRETIRKTEPETSNSVPPLSSIYCATGAQLGAARSKRKKHAKGEQPKYPLHPYLTMKLGEISSVYHDGNHKSSATSVAWGWQEARDRGLDEYQYAEFLYAARDITERWSWNIRGKARMPYFLSVLEGLTILWCEQYDERQFPVAQEGGEEAEVPAPPTSEHLVVLTQEQAEVPTPVGNAQEGEVSPQVSDNAQEEQLPTTGSEEAEVSSPARDNDLQAPAQQKQAVPDRIAQKIRLDLYYAGVIQDISVDRPHRGCGCPIYWIDEQGHIHCASCHPHATWDSTIRTLIAAIFM